NPLSSVLAAVYDGDQCIGVQLTDTAGQARFAVAPGTYQVRFYEALGRFTIPENVTTTTAVAGDPTSGIAAYVAKGAPTFTSGSPDVTAVTGKAYEFTFTASGTPAPTFTVVDGSAPDGLSLAPDGTLSGTPTSPGQFTFSVKASNAAGSATAG